MTSTAPAFDATRSWRVNPLVRVRPERFGALLYHYRTRRLSFVKSPELFQVLDRLEDSPSAACAVAEVGIPDHDAPQYFQALATLANTDMICPQVDHSVEVPAQ